MRPVQMDVCDHRTPEPSARSGGSSLGVNGGHLGSLFAPYPLPLVFRLRGLSRLPLHVFRTILASASDGLDVVDDVTRTRSGSLARGGARIRLSELLSRTGRAGSPMFWR